MVKVVLATHNPGKRTEWMALLKGLDLALLLPSEIGFEDSVAEIGDTYTENALIKARALCKASGLPALADDSGLEVDALDGAPGVRSARYRLGSDEVRYRALLAALEGVPDEERTARFRCVAALVLPDGETHTTEGVCEGWITHKPHGAKGFGYDPVFYIPSLDKTMAEISQEQKNQISHRARAARAMRQVMADALDMQA